MTTVIAEDRAQACAKCGATLTDDTRVHLWDGRDYCRDCVEAACPGMAQYAAEHDALEEVVPTDTGKWAILETRVPQVLVAAFLGLICFGALDAFWSSGDRRALAWGGVFLIIALLLVGWFELHHRLPAVVFARGGGIGMVRKWIGPEIARPPRECRWFFTEHVSWVPRRVGSEDRKPALVIEVGPWLCPCGWTPEKAGLWLGFLSLAGVQMGTKRRARRRP